MRTRKNSLSIIAIIYILLMIYLLFLMRIGSIGEALELSFSEHIEQYTNFIPFRSINRYGATMISGNGAVQIAVINLIGNIVVFIPMGFLLPTYFKNAKIFWKTVFIAILTIICVELIQFFSCTGTFDVDDIILNVIGVIIGFGFWKLYRKKK